MDSTKGDGLLKTGGNQVEKHVPEDKGNLVWYLFVLFGIGALLPWNAVLTALDFFFQSFPSHNPAFVFGLTLNAPNFTFNFVTIFVVKYLPLKLRIIVGCMVVFLCILAMPFVSNYIAEDTAWIIILAIIVIMGIASAFVQGGIFGFAGIFPFKYTGAVMLGNGLSGLSMNVLRMITLGIFPPGEGAGHDNSAFIGCLIYFAIASLFLIACIIGYLWVCKTEFAQYYFKKAGTKVNDTDAIVRAAARGSGSLGPGNPIENTPQTAAMTENDAPLNESTDLEEQGSSKSFFQVYADVSIMALQVFTCFVVTFVVFPGTTLSTKFDFLGNTNRDMAWFSVLMITLFNIFDTIGRFAGGYKQILSPNTLFCLTVFRLIFIPLFVLVQLKSDPVWIFQSDWFRILNMATFALTNGYNSTLAMIYGPTFADDKDKETAGIIMSFHLVGGIFMGALISSFAMDKISTPL